MRQAAERLHGRGRRRRAKSSRTDGYAALLRQHIRKEDISLPDGGCNCHAGSEQGRVANGFERVEHEETGEGIHEKYLALAELLERDKAQRRGGGMGLDAEAIERFIEG